MVIQGQKFININNDRKFKDKDVFFIIGYLILLYDIAKVR